MTKATDGTNARTKHDLRVELRPLTEIKPYERNPRQNDAAVEAVARSLAEYGFRQPIVVDGDGVIVVGHTRFKAAQKLGLDRVPVHTAEDLTPEQAKAYRIADNQTATIASWDFELLPLELADLKVAHVDLDTLGFSAAELDRLLNPAGDVVEDEPPEPPEDPITKPGDLWLLGDHRLLCGDSTKPEDVERVMRGEKAAAVMTDPPYGVDYVGKTKDALTVRNDGAEGLRPLLTAALGNAMSVCHDGGVWYIAAPAGPQFADFAAVLTDLGVWRQTLVWVKDSMVLGRSDYHYKHEAIFYGWKPGKAHKEPPDRRQTTVWEMPRPKASREHPTMKPVALYAKMMSNSTAVGSVVYEPFSGSGTTFMAAEQLGRKCIGIELDPGYCDVIVQRWEVLTQRKAVQQPRTVPQASEGS